MNTQIPPQELDKLWTTAKENGLRPMASELSWPHVSRGCLTTSYDCMIIRFGFAPTIDRHYVRQATTGEWREVKDCCGYGNDGSLCDAVTQS